MLVLPAAAVGRVRLATPGDVDALASIRNASWLDAYTGIVPDAELRRMSHARSRRLIADTIGRHRVAFAMLIEGDDGPWGYTLSGVQSRRELPYRGEVYELYLHPSRQRQGGGTQLLTSTLWQLSAYGLAPAMLWVLEANDARHFYAGCGGRPVRRDRIDVGGRRLVRVAYAWDEFLPLPR